MSTPAQVRFNVNPILTNLMVTGTAQAGLVAMQLFPQLPTALRGFTLAQLGDDATRRYNTRRAPGAATKQMRINWEGRVYTVDQHAIDVPIPRELIEDANEAARLNVAQHLDISRIAVNTALQVLSLGHELEAAALATDPAAFGANVQALSGGAKWSADTGAPVTDLAAASEAIRKASGRRPNLLVLSADAFYALSLNKEVRSYLPTTMLGPATLEQLKTILKVPRIAIGEAIWTDESGASHDVWGNNAILAYAPDIGAGGAGLSLGEPAFGFTSVLPGHPFVETPYFDRATKSWIYGATYERKPTLVRATAGFLFQNPK